MDINDSKPVEQVRDQADEQSPEDKTQQNHDIEQDVFAKQEGLFTSATSEMPA